MRHHPAAWTLILALPGVLACAPRTPPDERPAPATAAAPSPGPTPAAPRAAGTVVADSFWSQALGARKRYVVYLPPSYAREPGRRYPVAYYLHGLMGDEDNWTRLGRLDATMDSLVATGAPELIVVMPDGDDGWYTTWNRLVTWRDCERNRPEKREPVERYCVPWPHYDDYVARDLVARVDSTLRTVARRDARGIAGLSMGGYGAVTLALRYPEVFSAAASHSGVLSPLYAGPKPFAGKASYASDGGTLESLWGPRFWPYLAPSFGSDTAGWWARDPARLAKRLKDGGVAPPALFVDVGVADRLTIDQNRAFRAELEAMGIALRYVEWPGAHDWNYWRAHVGESLAWLAARLTSR